MELLKRHENFLRKLHSLAGIIPVGVFLIFHLFINHTATWGQEAYNQAAGFMVNLPFKLFLETFIIFLPLLFHALYGVYIALQAEYNVNRYHYFRNWNFFLQRMTGFVAFAFIAWHVWQTRVQVAFGAEPSFEMIADIVANPLFLVLYMIGIVSSVYHFTNGIFTFCITWGVAVSPKSQRLFQYVALGIFFVLSFIGVRAILAFV